MAAPNSYNFVVTRDNVITDALLYINALGEGQSASSAQLSESARVLNMILKLRAADIPAFALRRGTILPTTEVSSVNTNSHVVTTYGTTTIGAAEDSGQTVITVDSSSGMSAGDQIGIEMDDNTMHWTTIVSVDDATTITITTATDDEAADGNMVYYYTASTDRVVRPLRILDANVMKPSDGSSWEITVDARSTYFNLGNRTTAGTPNRIFYDQILGDRTADPATSTTWYGTFYVYPRFSGGDNVVEFTYQEPIQDVDSASDNLYIPQEFYLAVMMELAGLLGPRNGVSRLECANILTLAKLYREEALTTVNEGGSVFLSPDSE